jgi:multidrug transporter EmrE-like cation transporter
MKSILWIVAAVLCNASAQAALKLGASTELTRWQTWLSPALLAGLVLYGISFVLTVRVYADYPLGIISPLMAGAIFVLINLFSALLFHEPVTLDKVIGIVFIVVGIALLGRGL